MHIIGIEDHDGRVKLTVEGIILDPQTNETNIKKFLKSKYSEEFGFESFQKHHLDNRLIVTVREKIEGAAFDVAERLGLQIFKPAR